MSKLTEWIKLVPKVLKNPDKVLEGWINDIKLEHGDLSEDKIEEILRRRAICFECPFNSEKAKTSEEYKSLYGKNYQIQLEELHCSVCSCFIDKKTASLSSDCGLNYYNEKHPNNKQNLKWEKYDK